MLLCYVFVQDAIKDFEFEFEFDMMLAAETDILIPSDDRNQTPVCSQNTTETWEVEETMLHTNWWLNARET